jgi:hypothetical protein
LPKSAKRKLAGEREHILLLNRKMGRELFYSTIDFLIRAIESKGAEVQSSDEKSNLPLLEAQIVQLQRRLHLEFFYLSALADGDSQAR